MLKNKMTIVIVAILIVAGLAFVYLTQTGAAKESSRRTTVIKNMKAADTLGLPQGIYKSLTAKLQNVLEAIDANNLTAAVNQLNAFINEVEAQRGKKITVEQADELVEGAHALMQMIQ